MMQKPTPKTPPKAPKSLREETRKWWKTIVSEFVLESHHERLLTLACEAWDRSREAREALDAAGTLVFVDRHGGVKPRPEVGIEATARNAFSRLIRELGLDVMDPNDSRPTRVRGQK